MTSLTLYAVGAILVVIAMSAIPMTRPLVTPLMAVASYATKALLENGGAWLIWLIKRTWFDHATLAKHLVARPEDIDKSYEHRY